MKADCAYYTRFEIKTPNSSGAVLKSLAKHWALAMDHPQPGHRSNKGLVVQLVIFTVQRNFGFPKREAKRRQTGGLRVANPLGTIERPLSNFSRFMDSTITNLFNEYHDLTGSAEAAATLVLAEVQKTEGPILRSATGDGLLSLRDAAKYLGYDAAGLRKIVSQKRIRFYQNGRGPIKFKREWLDEFIKRNEGGPKELARAPAQRRRTAPVAESRFGLDPKPFRPSNRVA